MGWQSDVFPLEMCQSLPSVGEERRELQSLLLLVVNEGPGSLQVASVEVVHRHPRRSRVVVSCSVRIFQRTELVLAGNKKYLNVSASPLDSPNTFPEDETVGELENIEDKLLQLHSIGLVRSEI